MSRARILVCDDEASARRGVVRALSSLGYDLEECADGHACLASLAAAAVDLVLLDLRMPGLDGSATLARIVRLAAPPPVVILTADDSVDTAIAAVRAGAADFVTKPYDIAALRFVVERTLERAASERERRRLEDELARATPVDTGPRLRGRSPAMVALADAVARVAPSTAAVLVTGETGTGKGLVARAIHERSRVAAGPFVTVNCAAIPDALVESELFGYRRGAFTGAERDSSGRIRAATGGTLFLDEIGDLPLAAQAKLLRVLQDGVVEPLGGGGEVAVELRVVAATHRDLAAMVAAGSFREDLLFRLRVVELAVPPLRARGDDILELAAAFLAELSPRPLRLTPAAEQALLVHPWPGNVRELKNALERAVIFCRGGIVQLDDLPAEVAATASGERDDGRELDVGHPGEDFRSARQRAVERFERSFLSRALAAHGGNLSATARALGLHRQSLQKKLRAHGLGGGGRGE